MRIYALQSWTVQKTAKGWFIRCGLNAFETAPSEMVCVRRPDLLNLFQMRQCGLDVSRSHVGMALFALINCLIQMFDRFFSVRISLGLLTGLRVRKRGLGVSGEDISMSLLAMVNGLLGVCDGFGDMIFLSQRNLRHQKQSEAEAQHGDDESTGHGQILPPVDLLLLDILTSSHGEVDDCKPLQTSMVAPG